MPKVTEIPASKEIFTGFEINTTAKRRVAGYARVSTDHEEQQNSYEAQLDYFTKLINNNPSWIFAGMYSDEGITGTSTKRRTGFRKMIDDALDGQIDLIITKSVSRFARNTVDSLTTIRELKEHGVEVYFEKENIWTLDAKGELLITIMSSLAQEESRSISENTTWGIRKRMADGKYTFAFANFLGYEKGPDGTIVINEEEAKTVRYIYQLFLHGMGTAGICQTLEKEGLKSPGGKDRWHPSTVFSILSNEKYKGDCLIQKTFSQDFLTKKRVENTGQLKQYYITDGHPAIIPREIFDMVQEERIRRKKHNYVGKSIYGTKIKCGECGSWYSAKQWHSNQKYASIVYQCRDKYSKKKDICRTPTFREADLQRIFVGAYNQLASVKQEVLSELREQLSILEDTSGLHEQLQLEIASLNELSDNLESKIVKYAKETDSQEAYQEYYDSLMAEFEEQKQVVEDIKEQIRMQEANYAKALVFLETFEEAPEELIEFDEALWVSLLDEILVQTDGSYTVKFRNGMAI